MKTKVFIYVLIIFVLIVAILEQWPSKLLSRVGEGRLLDFVAQQDQLLPGPLRGSLEGLTSNLTQQGVVDWTNKQRIQYGKSELRTNPKLNKAAEAKLQDMFDKQYFEHVSPDGVAPADVVKNAQYAFLVVGENLALGNFKDDETLVNAWMNSPGHRENILHDKYQEIGVAVKKGNFEGKEIWLAVQEFGTPLSSCPSPSAGMKQEIERNNVQLSEMEASIEAKRNQIETSRYDSNESYNRAVEEYNQMVASYNTLSRTNKSLVEQYNTEVNTFNSCLERNG